MKRWLLWPAVALYVLSGCGKGENCYDRCDKAYEECKARTTTLQGRMNCMGDASGCINKCAYGSSSAPTAPALETSGVPRPPAAGSGSGRRSDDDTPPEASATGSQRTKDRQRP